jgi:transmembrane sensor
MKRTVNQKAFYQMVSRYLSDRASEDERKVVEKYYNLFSSQEDILDEFDPEAIRQTGLRLKSAIDVKMQNQNRQPYILVRLSAVAAAVLVAVAAGLYFSRVTKHENIKQIVKVQPVVKDIAPGGNKAILVLADGSLVSLAEAQEGVLANEKGVRVSKSSDGSLVYSTVESANASKSFNSVSTPRGGEYQLCLSDGTRVWLNAGTVLKYPVAFDPHHRIVSLSGEAYFQVSKDPKRPFIVNTTQQQIRVLGTHFNISAYTTDQITATTLLEGRIAVERKGTAGRYLLTPGEQAISSINKVTIPLVINQIDTAEVVAWKNGYFQFRDEDLESVLEKISRWYDIEIFYVGNNFPQDLYFNGTISKYKTANQVLRKLELSGGVRFQIKGRGVMVSAQ